MSHDLRDQQKDFKNSCMFLIVFIQSPSERAVIKCSYNWVHSLVHFFHLHFLLSVAMLSGLIRSSYCLQFLSNMHCIWKAFLNWGENKTSFRVCTALFFAVRTGRWAFEQYLLENLHSHFALNLLDLVKWQFHAFHCYSNSNREAFLTSRTFKTLKEMVMWKVKL